MSASTTSQKIINVKELPAHWEILPNRALFQERNTRGNEEEELLSVSITSGVTRYAESNERKDTSSTDKSNYKLVLPGDLVYNKMRMWQGAIGVSRYRGIVSPAYVVLDPRKELDPHYYFYLYKTKFYIDDFNRYSYGLCDDMNSLRYSDFRQLYSIYPPIKQQKVISAFLEKETIKIDAVITLLALAEPWKSDQQCKEILKIAYELFNTVLLGNVQKINSWETNYSDLKKKISQQELDYENATLNVTTKLHGLLVEYRETLVHHSVMGNLIIKEAI